SATNRDLSREVEAGRFREDLFYRLQVVPIHIPPLRERKEDLPLLVSHFIQKLAPRTNPRVSGIEDVALARMYAYRWPGNVRELGNVIEQALVFTDGERITTDALPEALRIGTAGPRPDGAAELAVPTPSGHLALPDLLDDLEKQLILKAYQQAKGVKTE